ncbi:hypothetical protein [Photobacterium carnosum]|uniref:hypothetical protein n=1 Tax=Photobacterium carnosum TaxID=2023717 RepID=UPI001E445F7F|nr:hypothetical protein [Photobacterium carnosum]MCD9496610.1 hypothetical protein [Photobacterium carnosum]
MNSWNLDPIFKNYCSMYREATESDRAPHEESMLHHVTSAVYFSIACIEAYLNQLKIEEMRGKGEKEEDILRLIKNSKFAQKLQNWPKEAVGSEVSLKYPIGVMKHINMFYDVRCGLIHPKLTLSEEYEELKVLTGSTIIEVTASFLAEVWSKKDIPFPYWLLGWNYVNPREHSQEILMLPNNQFLYSLNALDILVPIGLSRSEQWIHNNMKGAKCWKLLHKAMQKKEYCEKQVLPVNGDLFFSMKPRLCKEWWVSKHIEVCGTPSGLI